MGIDLNYLDDAHPLKDKLRRYRLIQSITKLSKQLKSKYIERELNNANDFLIQLKKPINGHAAEGSNCS